MVKKLRNYLWMCVILLVFSMSFLSAAAIGNDLHLNIQTTDASGNPVTGTFEFQFNITTDSACSNVVYSNTTSLTTDSRGVISYYLPDVDLSYSDQLYLCYYRDGTLINNSYISRTPYAFRAKYVNVSGIQVDSNLDLSGFNLTADYLFGDGSKLTNLNASSVNYWIQSGSDLYYNSGNVGIGTDSPGVKLDVAGIISSSSDILADNSIQATNYMRAPYMTPFTSGGSFDIRDYAGAVSYLSVNTTSGNVGINTTNPVVTFEVSDKDVAALRLHSDNDDDSNVDSYIQLGRGNTATNPELGWYLGFDVTDSDKFMIGGGRNQWDTPGAQTKFTIDTDGNVGIGTSSPSAKLEIDDTSNWGSGTAPTVIIRNPRPALMLSDDNQGTTYDTLTLWQNGDLGYIGLTNRTAGTDFGYSTRLSHIELQSDGDVAFNQGNVGIGTTNPSYELDVQGNVNAYDILVNGSSISAGGLNGTLNSVAWNRTGTDVYLANTNDNVGIGTTDPQEKFHVNVGTDANIKFGLTSGEAQIKSTNDADSAYAPLVMRASEYNLMNGNVGIGTSSPEAKLNVFQGSAGTVSPIGTADDIVLEHSTSAGMTMIVPDISTSALVFASPSDSYGARLSWNHDADEMVLGTANAGGDLVFNSGDNVEGMRLADSGNVGINETSPSDLLHITSTNPYIRLEPGTNQAGGLRFYESSNELGGYYYDGSKFNVQTYFNRDISLNTTNGGMFIEGTNGNVGIGITDPQSALHVQGSSFITGWGSSPSTGEGLRMGYDGDSSEIYSYNYTGSSWEDMNIYGKTIALMPQSGGNVGIGMTDPASKLEVSGDIYSTSLNNPTSGVGISMSYDSSVGAGAGTIRARNWSGSNWMPIYTQASNYSFFVGSNEAMVIDTSSNIGIGTTSPTQKLSVDGNINLVNGGYIYGDSTATYLYLNNSAYTEMGYSSSSAVRADGASVSILGTAGATRMRVTSAGDVGIGTTSPGYKLDVQGQINGHDILINGTPISNNLNGSLNSAAWNRTGTDVHLANTGDNVGVGIADPTEKFHLDSSGTYTAFIDRTASTVRANLAFGTAGTKEWYLGEPDTDLWGNSDDFFIGTSVSNPNLVIQQDGDIGIGTSSPGNALHLKSDTGNMFALDRTANAAVSEKFYLDIYDAGGTDGIAISSDTTTRGFVMTEVGDIGIGTTTPGADLHVYGSSSRNVYINASQALDVDGSPQFVIHEFVPGIEFRDQSTGYDDMLLFVNQNRMYVGNKTGAAMSNSDLFSVGTDGTVGIGTNSPETALDVQGGDILIDYNRWLRGEDSSGNNRILIGMTEIDDTRINSETGDIRFTEAGGVVNAIIKQGGDVGIGTSDPQAKLDVVSSSGTALNLSIGAAGSDTGLLVNSPGDGSGAGIVLQRAGNEYFKVQPASNYGKVYFEANNGGKINTGVNGGPSGDPLILQDESGGYVGINDTTPSSLLSIGGSPGAITSGLTFGDGDTGLYESYDDQLAFDIAGNQRWTFTSTAFASSTVGGAYVLRSAATSTTPSYSFNGDTDTGIGRAGADQLSLIAGGEEIIQANTNNVSVNKNLYVNGQLIQSGAVNSTGWNRSGTNVFLANTNDKVGIGTSSPVRPFHLNSSSTSLMQITNEDTGSTTSDGLLIGVDSDETALIKNYETTDMIFDVSGGDFVFTDGNVGIGTTSPTGLLSLNETPGALQATPTLAFGDGDTGFFEAADDDLRISIGGTQRWQVLAGGIASVTGSAAYLRSAAGSSTLPVFSFVDDLDTGMGRAAANELSLIAGATEMIRLNGTSGNVGIGTTSPGSKLEVNGTVKIGTTSAEKHLEFSRASNNYITTPEGGGVLFNVHDAPTESTSALWIQSDDDVVIPNGNVGINTTSPSSLLSIGGNPGSLASGLTFGDGDSGFYEVVDDQIRVNMGGATSASFMTDGIVGGANGNDKPKLMAEDASSTNPTLVPAAGDSNTGIGHAGADQLSLIAGGEEILQANTANVSINKDLYVNGQLIQSGAMNSTAWNRSGTDVFLANTGDSVGIGTSSPDAKLHIYTEGPERNTRFDGLIIQQSPDSGSPYEGFGANLVWKGRTYNNASTGNLGGISVVATDHSSSTTGHEMIFELVSNSTTQEYSERMRIDYDGNVGIGTSSPLSKLTINNNGTFALNQGLTFGDGDTGFYENVDDGLRFTLGGTDQIKIDSAGFKVYQGSNSAMMAFETPSATNPVFTFQGDDDTGIGRSDANKIALIAGGSNIATVTTNSFNVYNGGVYGSRIMYELASATNPTFVFNTEEDTGLGVAGADTLSLIAGGINGLNVNSSSGVARVGIGTTDPQSLLNLNASSGSLDSGLTFGDGDTGVYEVGDNLIGFDVANSLVAFFDDVWGLRGTTTGAGSVDTDSASSSTAPAHTFRGDEDTGVGRAAADELSLTAGGVEVARASTTNLTVQNNLSVGGDSRMFLRGDDLVFRV